MAENQKANESLLSRIYHRIQKNKNSGLQDKNAAGVSNHALPELRMLFCISDWKKVRDISGIFNNRKVCFHYITKGKGTASSEILDLLGIGAEDKSVITAVEQKETAGILMNDINKKIKIQNPGTGIAFTVPLSGINSPILRVFNPSAPHAAAGHHDHENANRRNTDRRKSAGNSLIISVINKGYSGEFMDAARKAGASGGTVMNARNQAHEGATKNFGISVQDEKEIIFILSKQENKMPIMQAVRNTFGPESKAGGIVFSLPVESVMGLSLD